MLCSYGWKVLNLNGPDDELQINQNWKRKAIDEDEVNDDETIVILIEDQRVKTRLKNNKVF